MRHQSLAYRDAMQHPNPCAVCGNKESNCSLWCYGYEGFTYDPRKESSTTSPDLETMLAQSALLQQRLKDTTLEIRLAEKSRRDLKRRMEGEKMQPPSGGVAV